VAGNTITLTLAGDATDLERAAARGEQSLQDLDGAVTEVNSSMGSAGAESQDMGAKLGNLGAAVDGISGAMDDASAAVQAFADLQNFSAERAQRLERALNDVQQAQEDYNQAVLDGRQGELDVQQANIDKEQALIDAATAQKDLTAAEKEFGKGSVEARQAASDLAQANLDLAQAGYDVDQAMADQRQSVIDAKGAQLDLNEAQKEANPSGLQEVANTLEIITPLMTGLISVVALATAAQWLWNIAMTANPIGLIIVGVAAIIAGIVLLATQVDWFGDFWVSVWDGIVAYVKFVLGVYSMAWDAIVDGFNWVKDNIGRIPGLIRSYWSGLFSILTGPFRLAFNFIADAWNNTVGRLSWTIPKWVPGVGGNTISAPRLPKFHQGGIVPGAPGTEVMALLQAGERVEPAGGAGARTVIEIRSGGTAVDDALVELLAGAIRRAGGLEVVFG
jgi:hypothetical protein